MSIPGMEWNYDHSGLDMGTILRAARKRWLNEEEVIYIITNYKTSELKPTPSALSRNIQLGTLLLYNVGEGGIPHSDPYSWLGHSYTWPIGNERPLLEVFVEEPAPHNLGYFPQLEKRRYHLLNQPAYEHLELAHYYTDNIDQVHGHEEDDMDEDPFDLLVQWRHSSGCGSPPTSWNTSSEERHGSPEDDETPIHVAEETESRNDEDEAKTKQWRRRERSMENEKKDEEKHLVKGGATVSPPYPSLIAGSSKWIKGEKLGDGGFGKVFDGFHSERGVFCAIKEVKEIQDAEAEKQLQKEIDVLTDNPHRNILNYYGKYVTDEGRLHEIYLEHIPPGSIDKILRQFGPFTESVIRNYTRQILSGLAHLHMKNIMHRDIKGANILVTSNGDVKLADFGMAKIIPSSDDEKHTAPAGTFGWMAPEVLSGKYGTSADIWSVGCTVYEMATKRCPWPENKNADLRRRMENNEIPEIPEVLKNDGKDFLRQCFKLDPKRRPTAADLLDHPFLTGNDPAA